jgi:hypothetical protein
LRKVLVGPPRDLKDRRVYQHISLIAFLAWVGLGADGLSSSSYGPEEAFRTLGEHTYLAVGLAILTAFTVLIISAAYSRIIERFPHGGGGYMVATSLLGPRAGVITGGALLVDYVLTITISVAAAGDAIFSLLPIEYQFLKISAEIGFLLILTILNMRGVRESVLSMTPIFIVFVITHLVLIVGAIFTHIDKLPETAQHVQNGFHQGRLTLGWGGMLLLFVHAYSLGGGTYTGIEAVSNGLAIMREPRVQTGKRTMLYMAVSLAFTAAGLIICYLLWNIQHENGRTMMRSSHARSRVIRCRRRVRDRHADFRRRAPGGGGAGGFRGRAARARQHGHRLVDAAPLRRTLGPPRGRKRHRDDGARLAGRHSSTRAAACHTSWSCTRSMYSSPSRFPCSPC